MPGAAEKVAAQMAHADLLRQLHTNQRLLVGELLRRGAEVGIVDIEVELLSVRYGEKTEFLLDRMTRYAPESLVRITADKFLVKKILRGHGVRVPNGTVFDGSQIDKAVSYAGKLGYPLVAKPNFGSHGDEVYTCITTSEELREAISQILRYHKLFILEEQCTGDEHRVFLTAKGDYAVLRRENASVVGDGINSIRELALIESRKRKERYGVALLCPLALDDVAAKFLLKFGKSFDYVPSCGEKVVLRGSSNIAKGGVGRDVTGEADSSVIDIARRVLRVFDGLPCIGVDVMTGDISQQQTDRSYAILEVNSNPGLSMHMLPAIGQPQNVASYLVDVVFPDLLPPNLSH